MAFGFGQIPQQPIDPLTGLPIGAAPPPPRPQGLAPFNGLSTGQFAESFGMPTDPTTGRTYVPPAPTADNPMTYRASVLPFGILRGGQAVPAFPDAVAAPVKAGLRIGEDIRQGGGTLTDEERAGLAFEAISGLNLGGGILAGPRQAAGDAILTAGGSRRGPPVERIPGLTYESDLSKLPLRRPVEHMSATYRPAEPLAPEKIVSPESFEGKTVFIAAPGDRTRTSQYLTGINGEPLAWDTYLDGGFNFMRGESAKADKAAWAATRDATTKQGNFIRALAREHPNMNLDYMYAAMQGRSGDFAKMTTDALLAQIPGSKLTRAGAAKMDGYLRAIHPEWPGLLHPKADGALHPEARDILLSRGPLRTTFAEAGDLKALQDEGFPDVASTRLAISEPELLGMRGGNSGMGIARVDPRGIPLLDMKVKHGTYDAGMQGLAANPDGTPYVGRFAKPIPYEVMYPDWYAKRRAEGKDLSNDYRSLQIGNTAQVAHSRWTDGIMKYIEDEIKAGR